MEWQLVQTISLSVCTLRRIFDREIVWEWQRRQVSRTFSGGTSENATGMESLPPPAFTCSEPGPWQPSQPVFSGFSLPEATLLKCGLRLNGAQILEWQVRQTSLPT